MDTNEPGVGYSDSYSFEEAFGRALHSLGLPKQQQEPGGAEVLVEEIGAAVSWGGVVGPRTRLLVKLKIISVDGKPVT